MKNDFLYVSVALILLASPAVAADLSLVENGESRAEIVIAEQPPRTISMAARELQTYVEKISGARLNIVTKPSGTVPLRVFVGRSSYTDKRSVEIGCSA
jgi:hypothetical protein